jgi:1-aminocyclopropane-1-carboxylate deaminase/D-cysteine desulfhydrase-like pyridoxal-dependent ACC family enzyme
MINLTARTEGIFLEPVYTSKTAAGLEDPDSKKVLSKDYVTVFL